MVKLQIILNWAYKSRLTYIFFGKNWIWKTDNLFLNEYFLLLTNVLKYLELDCQKQCTKNFKIWLLKEVKIQCEILHLKFAFSQK